MEEREKYYGADDLYCPHCGEKQYCHEPEEFTAYICTTVCENCGRTIEYGVTVSREYYPTIPDENDDEESEE